MNVSLSSFQNIFIAVGRVIGATVDYTNDINQEKKNNELKKMDLFL